MFSFLNVDSPFYRKLSTLTNYMILGALYIISCIGVITVGAASTAMYAAHHKVIENHEGYIWRTYWQEFRSNFKQATLLWLLMLLLTAFLVADCYLMFHVSAANSSMMPLFVIIVALSVLFVTWMRYWFPYIAHVADPIRTVLKNTMVMTVIHLPYTVCLALIYALCAAMVLFLPLNPITLMIAPILYVWLAYKPLTKVFVHYWDMSDHITGEPEEENER